MKVVQTCWQKHELLHGQFIAGMTASVDYIERWDGHDDFFVAC